MIQAKDLGYRHVMLPAIGFPSVKPVTPSHVFVQRVKKLLARMEEKGLDAVAIYADREHYYNLKYFTGFDPRFEEALLVIHKDGSACCALGNECLSLAKLSRIPLKAVLCQFLSLPDQPMDKFVSMADTMSACGLKKGMRLGVIDWKLITTKHTSDPQHTYAAPSFLICALEEAVGSRELLTNETAMLIQAPDGLRCCAEAAAIAELEFGAACASQSVISMMSAVRPGMSEREIASHIQTFGLPVTCHNYVVVGENARKGLISPSDTVAKLGDEITVSVGMEGGLTCRHAMVGYDAGDIAVDGRHYLEEIVKPYMAAVFNWYEMIGIGVSCGDLYEMVERCIPKEKYGWYLNPGHLTGYEEWMSAPIFPGSTAKIKSGMMFQMDIIPEDPVYYAPNAEDGIAIADESLRQELADQYPDVYARIMARRDFAESVIGLRLKPEVLPLSNCFAAYAPYIMSSEKVIAIDRL